MGTLRNTYRKPCCKEKGSTQRPEAETLLRRKQPYIQAQEANTLCYASFLRQTYYIYRPGILGLVGGRKVRIKIKRIVNTTDRL